MFDQQNGFLPKGSFGPPKGFLFGAKMSSLGEAKIDPEKFGAEEPASLSRAGRAGAVGAGICGGGLRIMAGAAAGGAGGGAVAGGLKVRAFSSALSASSESARGLKSSSLMSSRVKPSSLEVSDTVEVSSWMSSFSLFGVTTAAAGALLSVSVLAAGVLAASSCSR